MNSIWNAAKKEFVTQPIGTTGALIAILALFVSNPEILNVTNTATTDDDPTTVNAGGLITWLFLYFAVCYLFSKWNSAIWRDKVSTGVFTLPLFGILATALGVYLASVYLGGYPLLEIERESTIYRGAGVNHRWIGLPTPWFAAILSAIWVMQATALTLPIVGEYIEEGEDDPDGAMTALFSFLGFTILNFVALAFFIHMLIFGLVDAVAVSENPIS